MNILLAVFAVLALDLPTSQAQNLCENPEIDAADRLTNNTIHLYQENSYWTLQLRGQTAGQVSGVVRGPFKINYEKLAPVSEGSAVVTILHGERKNVFYKFTEDRKHLAWREDTGQLVGQGNVWNELPHPRGISAALHNDDPENPLIFGFANGKVYYFQTRELGFTIEGDRNGYAGGRNGENLPEEVTAAFSYRFGGEVYAFLFKNDEYCVRPLKYGSCSWRPNKELFGCDGSSRGPGDSGSAGSQVGPELPGHVPQEPGDGQPQVDNAESGASVNFACFYSVINFLLIFSFYYLL